MVSWLGQTFSRSALCTNQAVVSFPTCECSVGSPKTYYTGDSGQSWSSATVPASTVVKSLAVKGGRLLVGVQASSGSTEGNLFWAVSGGKSAAMARWRGSARGWSGGQACQRSRLTFATPTTSGWSTFGRSRPHALQGGVPGCASFDAANFVCDSCSTGWARDSSTVCTPVGVGGSCMACYGALQQALRPTCYGSLQRAPMRAC